MPTRFRISKNESSVRGRGNRHELLFEGDSNISPQCRSAFLFDLARLFLASYKRKLALCVCLFRKKLYQRDTRNLLWLLLLMRCGRGCCVWRQIDPRIKLRRRIHQALTERKEEGELTSKPAPYNMHISSIANCTFELG